MRGLAVLLVAIVAVTANGANECPSDWNVDKLLVHEDCHKFYMCTYGEPVEMTCWGDLYFNLENGQCDWQSNVDCGDRNIPGQVPTTTAAPETEPTTPEPTTPEPTTAQPNTTTAEPTTAEPTTVEPTTAQPNTTTPEPTTAQPNTTTPEPTTVEPTTIEPTTAQPNTTTPEPTTAQPNTTTAEPTTAEPTTVEPTTVQPNTTTAAPTTAEPSTTEPTTAAPTTTPQPGFLENGCPVDPHKHWLLPVEGDCNGFYYCVWGELVLRACPPTLHFNPVIQVCDWPENAGCSSTGSSINKHNMGQYSQRA